MKKRVISGWVTVTGPPRSIWRRKIGITEPDEPSTLPKRTGDEARVDVVAEGERLDDPLADRLRLAEQVLRVRGLVGRDEDEALDAELDRDLRHHARREHVVRHRLERVRLEHRHVLVRGGVEDDRPGG